MKLLQLKSGFISPALSPLVSEAARGRHASASRLECLPSDCSGSAFYDPELIVMKAEGEEAKRRGTKESQGHKVSPFGRAH